MEVTTGFGWPTYFYNHGLFCESCNRRLSLNDDIHVPQNKKEEALIGFIACRTCAENVGLVLDKDRLIFKVI